MNGLTSDEFPAGRILFSWIHLSDLHFVHPKRAHSENQTVVLQCLLEDITEALREQCAPRPRVAFVTGDIAFSGGSLNPTEYGAARAWLQSVASECGLTDRDLFVVPGNHDVQRKADQANPALGNLTKKLRGRTMALDAAFDEHAALLKKRFENYLKFASELGANQRTDVELGQEDFYWRYSCALENGLELRVAGLNSAILAGDDKDRGRLQLGNAQLSHALTYDASAGKTIVIVLSHHPFQGEWLRDEETVYSLIRRRAHIHLSGHLHAARAEQTISSGGSSLIRICAGAGHGDVLPKGVQASHGYNFGALVQTPEGKLQVAVWPRIWIPSQSCFRVNPAEVDEGRTFSLHDIWRAGAAWVVDRPSADASARAPEVGTEAFSLARHEPRVGLVQSFGQYTSLSTNMEPSHLAGKLSVDDSVLLYQPTFEETVSDAGSPSWLSRLEVTVAHEPSKDPLVNPTRDELLKAVSDVGMSDEIVAYLEGRAVGHDEKYFAKVGIRSLRFENHGLDRPMAITVAPTCQWIERQINRRFLTDLRSDPRLRELYEKSLDRSLASWRNSDLLELPAPGVMFLEACVLTSKGETLLHKKRLESGSTFAQIDRPWTCGIEVGLDWEACEPRNGIDFDRVLAKAMSKELGTAPDEIESVNWEGIALECHLNTALLCTVRTKLDSRDLQRSIDRTKKAGRGVFVDQKFVKREDVPRQVFAPAEDGRWHTTARLRVLLALRREFGAASADALIARERGD